jgi:hypothetical protein
MNVEFHTQPSSSSDGAALPDPPPQPTDYGALNAVYLSLMTAVVLAVRERAAREGDLSAREVATLGAATFALAKVIAHEKIGTWVREPFVDGHRRPVQHVRGRRLRNAVGELVTCTRCVGAWSALGLVGLRYASPSSSRVVNGVLATSAVNDFVQAAFRVVTERANAASG